MASLNMKEEAVRLLKEVIEAIEDGTCTNLIFTAVGRGWEIAYSAGDPASRERLLEVHDRALKPTQSGIIDHSLTGEKVH